jgi:hypothetical protein
MPLPLRKHSTIRSRPPRAARRTARRPRSCRASRRREERRVLRGQGVPAAVRLVFDHPSPSSSRRATPARSARSAPPRARAPRSWRAAGAPSRRRAPCGGRSRS